MMSISHPLPSPPLLFILLFPLTNKQQQNLEAFKFYLYPNIANDHQVSLMLTHHWGEMKSI